jgi:hypothetical protein
LSASGYFLDVQSSALGRPWRSRLDGAGELSALAIALSAALALAEAWGGLTLAYYSDWPTSFWITALSGIVFFGGATARRFAD